MDDHTTGATPTGAPATIDVALFDFSDVMGTIRMALAGDPGDLPYVVDPIAPNLAQVERLRGAGVRTGLVTNNDRRSLLRLAPWLDLEALFDAAVFSSDIGIQKPDHRIFLHALELLDATPERAIFFDDAARNVDAARRLGMHAVVVTGPEDVRPVVDRLLQARTGQTGR